MLIQWSTVTGEEDHFHYCLRTSRQMWNFPRGWQTFKNKKGSSRLHDATFFHKLFLLSWIYGCNNSLLICINLQFTFCKIQRSQFWFIGILLIYKVWKKRQDTVLLVLVWRNFTGMEGRFGLLISSGKRSLKLLEKQEGRQRISFYNTGLRNEILSLVQDCSTEANSVHDGRWVRYLQVSKKNPLLIQNYSSA